MGKNRILEGLQVLRTAVRRLYQKARGRIELPYIGFADPCITTLLPRQVFFLIVFAFGGSVYAETPVDFNRLADSIYLAEGGAKARVPYGIIYKGCTKNNPSYCRKICINTIRNAHKRYTAKYIGQASVTFIEYLASSYAPLGAKNDPSGLNRHWIRNVSFFYKKFGAERADITALKVVGKYPAPQVTGGAL